MAEESFRRAISQEERFSPDDFHILELLTPHLQAHGIIGKNAQVNTIKETDLRELAVKWKLKTYDIKVKKAVKRDQLLKLLHSHIEQLSSKREGRRPANVSSSAPLLRDEGVESSKKFIKPLEVNYFGLPPWALQRTTGGIIYQGRKPYDETKHPLSGDEEGRVEKDKLEEGGHGEEGQTESKRSDNVIAQRKVAHALLTMARNENMTLHFMQRGGLESVFKLATDSKLQICVMQLNLTYF